MAQKRMFDRSIIETDNFIDLPVSAKALYFLLGMEADDEGFVSPKRVIRMYGGNDDDVKILATKKLVIYFQSGVVVITHWHQNNWLDGRRNKPTQYQDEKAELALTEDRKYLLSTGSATAPQLLGKIRKEKKRKEKKVVVADATPFVLSEKLLDMEKEQGSHLDIIATYIREKELNPESSAELSEIISRSARIAVRLKAFVNLTAEDPMAKIYWAVDKCKKESKEANYDWSLETVHKKLTTQPYGKSKPTAK